MRIHRGWVRVLLPFHVRATKPSRTLDETLRAVFSGEDSAWLGLDGGSDHQKVAHSDYYEEYLPHVHSFLFAAAGATGCHYLKLKRDRVPTLLAENAEVWTRNLKPVNEKIRTHAAPSSPSLRGLQMIGIATADPVWKAPPPFGLPNCRLPLHATLDNDSGVEMWTSQLGAGLLSISLNCEPAGDGASQDDSFFEALLQLNHALTTAHQSVWLRPTNAAEITASGEPGEGRVNDDKTTQHLHQFVRDLLRPLWAESRVLFDQRGLVYSAIEVQRPDDPASDFERELFQRLSHLAQLHPHTHPGEDDVRHALELRINSRHLCAMSLTGAAHASILPVEYPRTKPDTFESDEEIASSSEYDRNRLSRIQRKYFPGFLLAQLQRLCLQRILDESTEVSSLDNDDLRHAEQQHLLEKVLRFGLEGEFVQACWRQTLQTHHELAQRVCEVPEGLKTVRRAMGDFNRMATERAEHRRYEEAEKSERTMHILEVFIVSFYSVELAHILGEAFHFPHTSFLASTLGGVAVLTFWLVALLFTWHPLRRAKIWGTIGSLFVIVALIQFSFLAANKWYASRHANDHPETESHEPADPHIGSRIEPKPSAEREAPNPRDTVPENPP